MRRLLSRYVDSSTRDPFYVYDNETETPRYYGMFPQDPTRVGQFGGTGVSLDTVLK